MGATRRLKTMRAILQKIVEETPGARGAIIMGYDGIVIERYKARGSEDFDIDTVVTEFSFRFTELRKAAESLDLGTATDIVLKMERGTMLFRGLTEEYFIVMVLGHSGQMGRGRWKLRQAVPELRAEF